MKRLLFFSAAVLFTLSCKKEEKEENPPAPVTKISNPSEFYPHSPGSYWVYAHYSIDSNGVAIPTNRLDSIWIDENHAPNVDYMSFSTRTYVSGFRRWLVDSAGYLKSSVQTEFSPIVFAPDLLKDTLYHHTVMFGWGDSNFVYTNRMKPTSKTIVVPAGTFEVYTLEENYRIIQEVPSHPIRTYIRQRARHVGLVRFQYGSIFEPHAYLHDPTVFEARLIRYHIN